MEKLLVICGPTATGKTSLAIKLAKKFNGEIISADSRQVYRGMDIGTGKEWGEGVKIWGYDLVDPKKEYSVANYIKFANRVLSDIWRRDKLPILVGGTGLYIKGVVDGIPTVVVPRNKILRKNLEKRSVNELYEILAELDAARAGGMNSSDRKNPRRLIRAIEIAQYMVDRKYSGRAVKNRRMEVLFIGLAAPKENLNKRINKRVDERVKNGVISEIKNLLKAGVGWNDQSMFSLGYRQWRDYFERTLDKNTAIDAWKKEERKYARRQMTWFKKDKRISWFDITDKNYPKNVEKLVKKWYITN